MSQPRRVMSEKRTPAQAAFGSATARACSAAFLVFPARDGTRHLYELDATGVAVLRGDRRAAQRPQA